jgi:hypothetical protein
MSTHLADDPSIPSVGQQIGIEGYTIVVAARCQCRTGGSLVPLTITCSAAGTVAQPNACPHCRLGYAINDMKLDAQGRLSFGFAVLSQAVPADS